MAETPAQAAQVATLTESILDAERRLAALFESGKPMPRVGGWACGAAVTTRGPAMQLLRLSGQVML